MILESEEPRSLFIKTVHSFLRRRNKQLSMPRSVCSSLIVSVALQLVILSHAHQTVIPLI